MAWDIGVDQYKTGDSSGDSYYAIGGVELSGISSTESSLDFSYTSLGEEIALNGSPSYSQLNIYYIDYDIGDDTNDGLTTSTPWKHCPGDINATNDPSTTTLIPGDVVEFKGGVIYRGQITAGQNGDITGDITYRSGDGYSWGTGRAKIYGSEQISTWSDDGGNIWSAICPFVPSFQTFFIGLGDTINWGDSVGDTTGLTNEFDWVYNAGDSTLYVYAASDPDSRYLAIEVPGDREEGIYLQTDDYIFIEGLEIAFVKARGIRVRDSSNITIDNIEVHHCGDDKNEIDRCILIQTYSTSASNITVSNSTLYEGGRHIIALSGGSAGDSLNNITIKNNIIYNSYHNHIDIQSFFGVMDNITIDSNTIYTTKDVSPSNPNCIFAQIGSGVLSNITIINNVLYSPGSTASCIGYASGVNGSKIFNNSMANAAQWITAGATCSNIEVKNNIGVDSHVYGLFIGDSASLISVDYNNWYNSSDGDSRIARISGENFYDFSVYQSTVGWDTNGLNVDPLYVNKPIDYGFYTDALKLKQFSPVIGQGDTLNGEGFTYDINGDSRGDTWDIGAYEYDGIYYSIGIDGITTNGLSINELGLSYTAIGDSTLILNETITGLLGFTFSTTGEKIFYDGFSSTLLDSTGWIFTSLGEELNTSTSSLYYPYKPTSEFSALLLIDGESGDTLEEFDSIVNTTGAFTFETTNVSNGNGHYRANLPSGNSNTYAARNFAEQSHMFFRFYIYIPDGISSADPFGVTTLAYLRDGTTDLVYFQVEGSGGDTWYQWRVVGNSTTSTDTNWAVDTWHYVEIEYLGDTIFGGERVWVDGSLIHEDVNQSTIGNMPDNIRISAVGDHDASSADYVDFDDIIISTTSIGAYNATESYFFIDSSRTSNESGARRHPWKELTDVEWYWTSGTVRENPVKIYFSSQSSWGDTTFNVSGNGQSDSNRIILDGSYIYNSEVGDSAIWTYETSSLADLTGLVDIVANSNFVSVKGFDVDGTIRINKDATKVYVQDNIINTGDSIYAAGIITYGDSFNIFRNKINSLQNRSGIIISSNGDSITGQEITYGDVWSNLIYDNENDGITIEATTATSGADISGINIYGNTLAENNNGLLITTSNNRTITINDIKNNIFMSNVAYELFGDSNTIITNSNYNLYYRGDTANSIKYLDTEMTWAQWQGDSFDLNGLNTDPLIDGNYIPNNGNSPVVDTGYDLGSSYNTDINSISRPQNAGWDIGAQEWEPTFTSYGGISINGFIRIIYTGITWGASNAEDSVFPQQSKTWLGWQNSSGDTAQIDTSYGNIFVEVGDSVISEVANLGDSETKLFSYEFNRFDLGVGTPDVYWRGDSIYFDRNDSQPTWQLFVQGNQSWRYIQIKLIG